MRIIDVSVITENIKEMCIEANHFLSKDMESALAKAAQEEKSPLGCQILMQLQENMKIAGEDMIPICQDTGMAVIFMEIGQEVHFEGGVDVFRQKFRRFLTPYPRQFSVLEGDRLHLFALSLILDAAKYDSVSGDLTFQGQRVQIDLPEAFSIRAEHSKDRRL